MRIPPPILLLLTACLAAAPLPGGTDAASQETGSPVQAQGRPAAQESRPQGQLDARSTIQNQLLPQPSVTRHEIVLPGRTLRYTATAGSLPVRDQEGRTLAEIAYIAYVLDHENGSASPASRQLRLQWRSRRGVGLP